MLYMIKIIFNGNGAALQDSLDGIMANFNVHIFIVCIYFCNVFVGILLFAYFVLNEKHKILIWGGSFM